MMTSAPGLAMPGKLNLRRVATLSVALFLLQSITLTASQAQDHASKAPSLNPAYDAELASKLGANPQGMRSYVLVILKSSTTPVAKGPQRDNMFAGHFANIKRLSEAGKLVVAGPLDKRYERRGLFVFAVNSIDEAQQLTESDPVIQQGEMLAEYHQFFSSAALMAVPELHKKLSVELP